MNTDKIFAEAIANEYAPKDTSKVVALKKLDWKAKRSATLFAYGFGTTRQTVRLEKYDCIGFASGIYGFEFQKAVVEFARQYLPQGKPVFFVYTYGGAKGSGAKAVAKIAQEKNCRMLGEFSCKGYDTFGPFKLVGGIAKGHPDERDLENARKFYREIQARNTHG